MIFNPLDYQLDYLKALHLIYSAFPAPIKCQYFQAQMQPNLTTQTSLYSHELDSYSSLRYLQFVDLPVYMIDSGYTKTQEANETGVIFRQDEINIVFPSHFGIEPTNADKIAFTSVNHNRLFKVVNIQISNFFEKAPLRFYRLTLQVDKYEISKIFERVDKKYILNYDVWYFFEESKFKRYTAFLNFLDTCLKALDMQVDECVNNVLAYLYEQYKVIWNILLAKYMYNNFQLLSYDSLNPCILILRGLPSDDPNALTFKQYLEDRKIQATKDGQIPSLTSNDKFYLLACTYYAFQYLDTLLKNPR